MADPEENARLFRVSLERRRAYTVIDSGVCVTWHSGSNDVAYASDMA